MSSGRRRADPYPAFTQRAGKPASSERGVRKVAIRQLLSTMGAGSNPITRSDVLGRTDLVGQLGTSGHQINDSSGGGGAAKRDMVELVRRELDQDTDGARPRSVFRHIKAFIPDGNAQLRDAILAGRGTVVTAASKATHVICRSTSALELDTCKTAPVFFAVTPDWVWESWSSGARQPESSFAPPEREQ